MKKQAIYILEPSYLISQGIRSLMSQFFESPELTFSASFRKLKQACTKQKPDLIITNEMQFADFSDEWQQLKCQIKVPVLIFVFSDNCQSFSGFTSVSINSGFDDLRKTFSTILPRPESSNEEISLREKEILALVAQGLSNKEIGDKLNISINTVTTHRKNITRKLGIKTASGLTVYAILNNLINIKQGD
jgi:two-component system, NarL family, response regulator NreC